MKIVIANTNCSTDAIFKNLEDFYEIKFINQKDELSLQELNQWAPKYIFFPHWSFIIPNEIFNNFECIVFHMTDLPFGRGGSPLQNLISRGITTTKISALRVNEGLDTGDIYLKKDLELFGRAVEIYQRAAEIISQMIFQIINLELNPTKQKGTVVTFSRRTPEESNIYYISDLKKMFDFIRMLDAPGYPKAFLDTPHFKLEFENVSKLSDGDLSAKVTFKKK